MADTEVFVAVSRHGRSHSAGREHTLLVLVLVGVGPGRRWQSPLGRIP